MIKYINSCVCALCVPSDSSRWWLLKTSFQATDDMRSRMCYAWSHCFGSSPPNELCEGFLLIRLCALGQLWEMWKRLADKMRKQKSCTLQQGKAQQVLWHFKLHRLCAMVIGHHTHTHTQSSATSTCFYGLSKFEHFAPSFVHSTIFMIHFCVNLFRVLRVVVTK